MWIICLKDGQVYTRRAKSTTNVSIIPTSLYVLALT